MGVKSKRSLKEIMQSRQKLFTKKPKTARYNPTTVTEWKGGLVNENHIRNHVLVSDYPEPSGGTDTGVNPMEMVLAALGSCVSAVFVEYAELMDIQLDGISVEVSGEIDLRGLFNVADISSGFESVTYNVTLKSPESQQRLDELTETVKGHCPVSDSLKRAVDVKFSMKVER